MDVIILVIQLFLAILLIGVVLLQRSSSSGLGLGDGGGAGGFSSLMAGRGTANTLTRSTALIAASFILICLISAVLASRGRDGASTSDIEAAIEEIQQQESELPLAPVAPSAGNSSSQELLDMIPGAATDTNPDLPVLPTQ